MEVNGQLHASVALPSWKDRGCVGPGVCPDFGEEKNLFYPAGNRTTISLESFCAGQLKRSENDVPKLCTGMSK